MASSTIYLVRHGETDWNLERRYQGQKDIPMNATGIEQARTTARELEGKKFDAIYSSDLSRAFQTALPIAENLNMPIITNPALREIDQGEWEGIFIDEITKNFGSLVSALYKNPYEARKPGGETIGEVADRAYAYLDEITRANDGKTIVVVTHGMVIGTILCKVNDLPLSQAGNYIPNNAEFKIITWVT